jgi:hypothetical protein
MGYLNTYNTIDLVKAAYNIALDKAENVKDALIQLNFVEDIEAEMADRGISYSQFREWIDRHHSGELN